MRIAQINLPFIQSHRISCGCAVAMVLALCVGRTLADIPPEQAGVDADQLRHIEPLVDAAYERGNFCGCVVALGRGQGVFFILVVGDRQVEPTREPMTRDAVFDLASLTKPVATATSVMLLAERGLVRLSDPACMYLPELDRGVTRDITIDQLLTHTAGYIPDNAIEDYQDGASEAIRRLLSLDPEVAPGARFKYSDVGFELLGLLVERVAGEGLNTFSRREVFAPLGMLDTAYVPAAELRQRAVATELRDGKWLVGEVHDPRAALLGGVAGHAGLFSTADDLARYAQVMLAGGQLGGTRILGAASVDEMIRPRAIDHVQRSAGWDIRSPYSRNRGDFFSARAFGHGGFTGTAMWIDPELDLFVIFLSSRLHPDGKGAVNDLVGRIGNIAAASIE